MEVTPPVLTTAKLVYVGFRDLLKPPFRTLLAVSLFVTLASDSFGTEVDGVSGFLAILLLVVSAYLQISVILAAAEVEPAHSADTWVRKAFAQRCFWRFFLGSLLAALMVLLGLVALVVPGFVLGGVVALTQTATVLERRRPIEAIRRSALVGRMARRPLATVFLLLVLLPNLTLQLGVQTAGGGSLGAEWVALDLLTVVLYTGAAIALTRAFVTLRSFLPPEKPIDGSSPNK